MTDITELAQSLKRRAASANEFGESLYVKADNVLAVVEALELKEEQRANWFHMAQKLGNNLDAAEKRIAELEREPAARMVVTPTIWKHYTAAQTAIIYEKAMTDAGIKWRSIDERLTHEELESQYFST